MLRSVCSNSQWKYAVLWKIQHGNPTILSWEDGYIDCPKPRQPVENKSEDVYCNRERDASELSYGSVVSELSRIQYAFGEGLVGQVATTGNHSWVSFSDIFNEEGKLNPTLNIPEEWLVQFASGIKTIVLVPLLPLGVLQLGSTEEVDEDISAVASLKSQFSGFHNIGCNYLPASLKRDAEMSSCLTNHLLTSSAIPTKPVKFEDPDNLMALAGVKVDIDNIIPAISQLLPLLSQQHTIGASGDDLLEALELEYKRDNELASPECYEECIPVDSLGFSQIDLYENKLIELSSLMEELQSYSEFANYNLGGFGESFGEFVTASACEEGAGKLYGGEDADQNHVGDTLKFPPASELHKALGPAFWKQSREMVWDSTSWVDRSHGSSNFICNQQIIDGGGPPDVVVRANTEYLLDAVVSNAQSGSAFSYHKSSPNSLGYFSAAPLPQKSSEKSSSSDHNSAYRQHITSECTDGNRSPDASTVTSNCMKSTILDKEHQKELNLQGQKGEKTSNITKRKAKPGESQKPRPRDRQLIQDRVKELRELVPNGGKCSIDGLLDRTIKHMMYLRSVNEQAERLKQWALQEVTDRKHRRSPTETGNKQPNGTSWAFEFGSNPHRCPMVVEDLPCPGHMLIEMLCNEQSMFLEIAQVIRGLDLTILKGIMESRDSETWAHFIVEASQGFHRLDIFWPLMQLLQRKRPISSKI